MADDTKSQLSDIRRFYSLQAERVETYALFEEGFAAYLKGAPNYNLQMYKELVNQITTTFNNISKDILDIEKSFCDEGRTDISGTIRNIQETEQLKLKNTAELQMIRQKEVDEPGVDLEDSLSNLKESLREHVEKINEDMENLKYDAEDLYADDG